VDRYSVVSKGLTVEQIAAAVRQGGGKDIKSSPLVRQVFCTLEASQAAAIDLLPGLSVKKLKKVKSGSIGLTPLNTSGLNMYNIFAPLWAAYSPLLNGKGMTAAVLDTGIRGTHNGLQGKVVDNKNFTCSDSHNDNFGHGTQVAFVIAGQSLEYSGVAPGVSLMNVKVIGDDGEGTEEEVIQGLEYVCSKVTEAAVAGKMKTDPSFPNTVNMSIGMEDDGDYDNPLRIACRVAKDEYGLQVVAAAGNEGPTMTTIVCPACDPSVVAVGGICSDVFEIWEGSSRGPTIEGSIKPDLVAWSTGILSASNESDDEYVSVSGTSFACPILVGLQGILWQLARGTYGESIDFTLQDVVDQGPVYCIKPEGYSLAKDDIYGYGIPAISSIINQLQGGQSFDISSAMMMMMMMQMMGGFLG